MEEDSGDDSDDENDLISITQDGARILQFSPDGKWLLVITPESKAVVVPIEVTESTGKRRSKVSISLSPEIFVLGRIPRTLPHEKTQQAQKLQQANTQTPSKKDKNARALDYGNLSSYPHTISRIAFSSNSKILVVTDLMGHLDSYILQGEHWVMNPAGGLLPKLEYPLAAMEFRPQSSRQMSVEPFHHLLPAAASKGSDGGSQQPLKEGLEEDRLMVLTAHSQAVFEFHILKGRLTDWSRRNPPSRFVKDFRNVVDIGCGIVWEIEETDSTLNGETTFTKERVWFWGPNWIWMFDLQQDFPDQGVVPSTVAPTGSSGQSQAHKRKRGVVDSGKLGDASSHKSPDGDGDVAMLDDVTPSDDDDDDDSTDSRWGMFSRIPGKSADNYDTALASVNPKKLDSFGRVKGASNPAKPHWRHYKYRPIMALLPIGEWGSRVCGVDGEEEEDGTERIKELVVVERPAWDIELPPRFFGKRERTDELRRGIWA